MVENNVNHAKLMLMSDPLERVITTYGHHQHLHHHHDPHHHHDQHHQDHDQHYSIIASASSASLSGNGGISRSASEGSLQENLSYRNSDHTIIITILIIIIITSITCTANAILITISFLFSHLLDTPLLLFCFYLPKSKSYCECFN